MNRIELMDCTLRDGGWVNDFAFGREMIASLPALLSEAGIRRIELGYLDERSGRSCGYSMYSDFDALYENGLAFPLPAVRLVMIDYGKYPVNKIPERVQDGTSPVDGIRFCFHKEQQDGALAEGREILEKGYRLYLQPMITTRYSDEEFVGLIEKMQKVCRGASAFYIVDSFGVMGEEAVRERLLLADSVLDPGIILGFHAHNNMSLSFSNSKEAVDLIGGCRDQRISENRRMVIDATMMGMGKGAGNLRTEEFAAYLNRKYGAAYNIEKLMKIRDDMIVPFRQRFTWGYSPEFELTSRYGASPTYARLFVGKLHLPLSRLEDFLRGAPENRLDRFDRELAAEYLSRHGIQLSD